MNYPDPRLFGEILARVGFAVWQSQVLERAVAYHLVLVYNLSPGAARSEAAAAFDRAEGQTLGTLLRKLGGQQGVDQNLLRRLDSFREERNWLVHHSRHGNESAVHHQLVATPLKGRLDAIASDAVTLADEVQRATDDHLVRNAIMTSAEIELRSRELRETWGAT